MILGFTAWRKHTPRQKHHVYILLARRKSFAEGDPRPHDGGECGYLCYPIVNDIVSLPVIGSRKPPGCRTQLSGLQG
jgi:hypothetical protein